MKNNKYILLISVLLIFSSCSQDEVNEVNEDLIASSLSFKKLNLEELNNGRTWCGQIVAWDEWGRASRNCDGWGLCNAQWFPPCEESGAITYSGFATTLEQDLNNQKHYIEILLDQPTSLAPDTLTLFVDNPIILYTASYMGHDHTFQQGSYSFDESLGDFGGYKIYLD